MNKQKSFEAWIKKAWIGKKIMGILNRNTKMEFYTVIPELLHLAPILPARKFRPEALVNAARELVEAKHDPDFGSKKYTNLTKCAGISDYVRYGYVLTAWQDFVIETNGDKLSFKWETSVNHDDFKSKDIYEKMIDYHAKSQYAEYIGGIPESLNTIVKINTPWRCIIPKGYFLKQAPLPYTNERRFTTATGFLSRDFGVTELNVQLFWHVLEGRTVIKAGTPLAHYMLIPKNQPEMTVGIASDGLIAKSRATMMEKVRRNVSNHKESKCIFARILGEK